MGRRNLLVGTRFGLHKCTYFKLAESKGRDAHRTKQSATLSTTELLAVPQKVHQRHYVRNSCEGYNNSITPAIKLPESTKSSELSATGLTQQYACLTATLVSICTLLTSADLTSDTEKLYEKRCPPEVCLCFSRDPRKHEGNRQTSSMDEIRSNDHNDCVGGFNLCAADLS